MYCLGALYLASYYILDQGFYQHAVIRMMAAQTAAILGIGHGNLN